MLNMASRCFLLVAISGTVVALLTLLKCSISRSGFEVQDAFISLAWSYTPSTVLVLLGYAIEGASNCAQALSSYTALQEGSVSGHKSVLFNQADRSALVLFCYSYWKSINWTVFTSSFVVLIYSIIKVTAAGLYGRSLGQHTFTAAIGIDQSLISNLDKLPVNDAIRVATIQIANTLAVWKLTPQLRFSSPSGTGGSFIFSNLSSMSLPSAVSQALDHEGLISANVPAIQVQVNCSAYIREDFQIVKEGNVVSVSCRRQSCRRYFPEAKSALADGMPDNTNLWRGGFNLSGVSANRYCGWLRSWEQALADPEDYGLAPISGLFMKIDDYGPNLTSATQRFNITPKAIAGFSCVRSLSKVNVNVTFARAVQQNLGGTSLLSADISSFDDQSILPALDSSSYTNTNVTVNYPGFCVSALNVTCGPSTSWMTPDWIAWTDENPEQMLRLGGSTKF